ncbi:MAG: arsenate reductase (glutaredoxin) [Aestuariibaculum sp.]
MLTIYHNNRCSKSRNGLEFLEKSGKEFKIVNYLEDTLTFDELKDIISLLDIKPIDLVRKNEALWKSDYKGKILSNNETIQAMVDNPKLIERPIVVNGKTAVVGRPLENILKII